MLNPDCQRQTFWMNIPDMHASVQKARHLDGPKNHEGNTKAKATTIAASSDGKMFDVVSRNKSLIGSDQRFDSSCCGASCARGTFDVTYTHPNYFSEHT